MVTSSSTAASCSSRPLHHLLIPYVATGTALGLLFAHQLSLRHLAFLAATIALVPVLSLVRTDAGRSAPASRSRGADVGAWLGVILLIALAVAKYALVWHAGRDYLPALHDEWSYYFGAQILARGRLVAPAPPDAEAFQAFHVLIRDGVWSSRYPPGHPALLALGLRLGHAWLVPIACAAASMLLATLWSGYRYRSARVALWTGALLVAAPGLDEAATGYLSQSSWLLWSLVAVLAVLEAVRLDCAPLSALAGFAGVMAFLTRPYSALLLGIGLALWATPVLLRQRGARRLLRHLVAVLVPATAGAGIWFGYNYATTGQWLLDPWTCYNQRFEPYNRLGVGLLRVAGTLATSDPRFVRKAEEIRRQRTAFTWREALRRSFGSGQRLRQYALGAAAFVGTLALAGTGLICGNRSLVLPLAMVIVVHYVGYGLFYSTWGAYALEPAILLVLLSVAGTHAWWCLGCQSGRPLAALAVVAVIAVNVAASAVNMERLVERRRDETAYHRKLKRVADGLPVRPAVVFVRLDPQRPHPYDPINNDPWLQQPVLFALDRGTRHNRALLERFFPDRAGYLYEERSGTVTRIR